MGLLLFAFVFNFFSTWYFGWHVHPNDGWEHAIDHYCMIIATLGLTQIMWKANMKKRDKDERKRKNNRN